MGELGGVGKTPGEAVKPTETDKTVPLGVVEPGASPCLCACEAEVALSAEEVGLGIAAPRVARVVQYLLPKSPVNGAFPRPRFQMLRFCYFEQSVAYKLQSCRTRLTQPPISGTKWRLGVSGPPTA